MEKKITIGSVLGNGFQLGIKNAASLLGCIVLWVLTCWIPYINIGTTIAMSCLPMEIAKGNIISPTVIFNKKYFKYLGEYFLISSFMASATILGMCFFIIPGIVISIAWSLAILFMIDKELNPLEALTHSNKATTGYKWTIFLVYLVFGIVVGIITGIFSLIPFVGWLLNVIVLLVAFAAALGINAYIYSKLSE